MAESLVHTENGWALYAHPLFVQRLDEITGEVERAAIANPEGFHHHRSYKLFDAVSNNVLNNVPANPAHPIYRQGKTLGRDYLHWFRVKKQGLLPRYRLFFQFKTEAPKAIIYAWLNDERTVRRAGDRADVYAVFAAMLSSRKMPNAFADLLAACDSLKLGDESKGAEQE